MLVLVAHFNREDILLAHAPLLGAVTTKIALMGLRGVELFFVLSGFLITGILLRAKNEKDYFRNFYARRCLRIIPLYYSVLLLVFALGPAWLAFDDGMRQIQDRQIWLWTYLANFPGVEGAVWNSSRLFAFGHIWSLCVEEHFYLIWPAVVWLTPKTRMAVTAGAVFLIMCGISITVGVWQEAPQFLRWTTLAKSSGLAAGALIACWHEDGVLVRFARRWRLIILCLSFLGFVAAGFVPRRISPPFVNMLKDVFSVWAFTALLAEVILAGGEGHWGKLFTNRTLVMFGKYSYALYVLHGLFAPTFSRLLAAEQWGGALGFPILGAVLFPVASTALSLALAWVTWHVLEEPCLRLKRYFE